jgi:hypothetical protein
MKTMNETILNVLLGEGDNDNLDKDLVDMIWDVLEPIENIMGAKYEPLIETGKELDKQFKTKAKSAANDFRNDVDDAFSWGEELLGLVSDAHSMAESSQYYTNEIDNSSDIVSKAHNQINDIRSDFDSMKKVKSKLSKRAKAFDKEHKAGGIVNGVSELYSAIETSVKTLANFEKIVNSCSSKSESMYESRDNRFSDYSKWRNKVKELGYSRNKAKSIHKCYDDNDEEMGHFDYRSKTGMLRW